MNVRCLCDLKIPPSLSHTNRQAQLGVVSRSWFVVIIGVCKVLENFALEETATIKTIREKQTHQSLGC